MVLCLLYVLVPTICHLTLNIPEIQLLRIWIPAVQWGSEIQPFEIKKHGKSWLFKDNTLSSPVFKGSVWAIALAKVPTIWKLDR